MKKLSRVSWLLLACLVLFAVDTKVHSDDTVEEDEALSNTMDREPQGSADYRTSAITLNDRIEHAIVYSDRANLVRHAEPVLSAGKHWVQFSHLPENLDKSTLRAEVKAPGKLIQLVMEEVYEHVGLSPETQRKVGDLRDMYARLLVLTQEQSSVADQITFVSNLTLEEPFKREPAAQVTRGFKANIGNVKASLDEIKIQVASLTDRSNRLAAEISALNGSITLTTNELKKVTSLSEQKWVLHSYLLVETAQKGPVPVEISYTSPNAKWYPTYDIRAELNRESNTADLKIVTSAQFEQRTGEDWKNIGVTFSSLDPVPLYLPKLTRWAFEEHREEDRESLQDDSKEKSSLFKDIGRLSGRGGMARSEQAPSAPAAAPARANKKEMSGKMKSAAGRMAFNDTQSQGASLEVAERDGAPTKDDVSSHVAMSFPLMKLEDTYPALKEIGMAMRAFESNRQYRALELDALRNAAPTPINHSDSKLPAVQARGRLIELKSPFAVDLASDGKMKTPVDTLKSKGILSYFAVPKMDNRVFLRAKLVNDTNRLLLAGDAQIFMDGELITQSSMPTIDEGGEFAMDLGVDKNIETKRMVTKKSESKGLMGGSRVTKVEVKIEISNHHSFPVRMEIKDHYPLSPEERLKVELVKTVPTALNSKDGLLAWEFQVPANEKKSLTFTYQVTHPENAIVSEFN